MGSKYSITIVQADTEHSAFFSDGTQSLLDSARSNGHKIPYACKGGGCGLCKIKVVEGDFVRGPSSKAVLPDSDRELNLTLACKTYPKSDMKIMF